MDWSNERYVRVYVRDTRTWLKLRWEGQCLFMMLLRKVDRAGVLDDIEDPVDDLSLMTGLPAEHVEPGIERLVSLGVVEINDGKLLIPNYIEAQETPRSDAQRQREFRERRRDYAKSQNVTDESQNATKTLHGVTPRHAVSRGVTLNPDPIPMLNYTDPLRGKKEIKKKESYSEDFQAFWAEYPRKKHKGTAFKAWKKAKENGLPKLDVILAAVKAQKESRDWKKDNGQFIPHPATWINGKCWDDETENPEDDEWSGGWGD